MKDSLAVIAPADTAIGPPTATARRLVDASVSDNTRRAYAGALGQLDAWLDGQKLDDVGPGRLPRRAPRRRPRRSKTNQAGETSDVRYLKNGAARLSCRRVPAGGHAAPLMRGRHGGNHPFVRRAKPCNGGSFAGSPPLQVTRRPPGWSGQLRTCTSCPERTTLYGSRAEAETTASDSETQLHSTCDDARHAMYR